MSLKNIRFVHGSQSLLVLRLYKLKNIAQLPVEQIG